MPRPFFVLTLLASLFFLPYAAAAQAVRGRALDPHSKPVANADVIVANGAASVVAETRTANDGHFGPIKLPPGAYSIVVSAPGLRSASTPVTLTAGNAADLNITLQISAVHESIVVSAAQVEMASSRVADAVTVIDRAEVIRRQAEVIADVLRLVPGFGVLTSGGRGAITSVFPRGGESDYTLVLVDGIPQNAFGGGFDASHLAAGDIERLEVVRGPQSALYGSGAIGGVVQLVTRNGGPFDITSMTEGGSNATTREAITGSGTHRQLRWGASFDGLKTNGDTREFVTLGRRVANNDDKHAQVSGSMQWTSASRRSVRVVARSGRDELGTPGPYGSDPIGAYGGLDLISRNWNWSKDVGASGVIPTGGAINRWQVAWADFDNRFRSPDYFNPTQGVESTDSTRRISARYQLDFTLPRLPVSTGAELVSERADNTYVTGASFQAIPVNRRIAGIFVEARPAVGSRASINLGVRAERIARMALEGDNLAAYQPRPTFADDVIWSVNPKISGAWFVHGAGVGNHAWTKLRFGAGTGIKPPTVFEIAFTDNPALKPERSRSWDAGIEQGLWRSTVVADLTWFSNRYDDLIVAVGSQLAGASKYRTDNIANARARGLEIGATWHARFGTWARVAWTHLDSSVLAVDNVPGRAPSPFAVGDPLLRRPSNQGAIEVGWSHGRLDAFVAVNGRGRMLDTEPNFGASGGLFNAPGYKTIATGASAHVFAHVDVFGRVSNVANRAYEEVLGFPSLGRTASIGIRIAARR